MDPQTRETLADLLLAWEDAFRNGRDPSPEDLARDHPELVEPLTRWIRVLKKTFWIDHPGETVPDEDEPPPPGGRVLAGRYRLDERVALGGFAEVWRAFDSELERVVAVKIPKASRIGWTNAFLAEARRVACLRHPAIVPVHDVGVEDETCFIVSEFVDGGSLADRLAGGPLEPSVAARWIAQIADALDYAHRNGIVHSDVKPANILLNHHGDAVLADFGIARSATTEGECAPGVGTLRYMSPEQLAGGPVGPATDVHGLGVVLHEALTGSTPEPAGAAATIRGGVPHDRGVRPSPPLPPRLAAVCRRALHRAPGGRHPSAAAFAADLRRAAGPGGRGWLGPGLAAAALLGVLPFTVRRSPPAPEPRAVTLVEPRVAPVEPRVVLVEPRMELVVRAASPAPPLDASAGSQTASVTFHRIAEARPHVVASRDVVMYSEWQEPPHTYVGPLRNDAECVVVYRFDFVRPVAAARLIAQTRCWDFTREPGGLGRGAAAVDASADGDTWLPVRDGVAGADWGRSWTIDEPLPADVLGGTSLWIRARFLTEGSPNAGYSVAQFGRNRDDPSQPTFGIVAELEGPAESGGSSRGP